MNESRIIIPERNIVPVFRANNVGVKTRFMVRRISAVSNEVRQETGWSYNTLLTNGRNQLGQQSNWAYAVQLGTDFTAPDAGQSGLLGYVNGTSNVEELVFGAQSSAPWYGWKRIRFRFLPGEVVGNLNEVGLGWSISSGSTIAFRELLEYINGIQTTVTPLPDEYVDVVVEIRCYPPLTDATGTVAFNGVTYDYIVRASEVTSSTWWGANLGTEIRHLDSFSSWWSAFDDDIGATLDLGPSGVAYLPDGTNAYDIAYSNNSYQRKMAQIGGPTAWNATTGKKLRSLRFVTTAGAYQVQFDSQSSPGTGIPKTDGFNIKFQFVVGWQEQVIP
jgi:hypothetical protein